MIQSIPFHPSLTQSCLLLQRYPNDLKLALTADDLLEGFREGKIASLIGMVLRQMMMSQLGADLPNPFILSRYGGRSLN